MNRRLAFILNPRSGRQAGRPSKSEILKGLLSGSRETFHILETEYAGHATKLAAAAAADGIDIIVAYGGDGTVNEVACGIVGTTSSLGILPAGSGNGMARGLGIPTNFRKALALIRHGRSRIIDAGSVNGSFFFNIFGMGFDAYLAGLFHQKAGDVRGQLPYFTLGIRAYISYQPVPVSVVIDGESIEISPLTLAVANGPQYGSGARIAPEADFSDGMLDLISIDMLPVTHALLAFPRLFTGSIAKVAERRRWKVKELKLGVPAGTLVHFDGEVRPGAEEMQIAVHPKALRVIAP